MRKKTNNFIKECDTNNCGHVIIKLREIMDDKGFTINQMARITGIQYHSVKKYYEQDIGKINLKILAKFCCALGCLPSDILVYEFNRNKFV